MQEFRECKQMENKTNIDTLPYPLLNLSISNDKISVSDRLYCTDLDGTIICNKYENSAICVATKNGKPSSFMRKKSYILFQEIISKILVLPVTTRCKKSYENILIKNMFDFALVENGAQLICKSLNVEEDWINESRKILYPFVEQMEEIRKVLEKYDFHEKWGSEFVLDYVTSKDNEDSVLVLKEELNQYKNDFLITFSNHSLTVIYKGLSKGKNIKRFAKKFGYQLFLSSGDRGEDESMYAETLHSIGRGSAEFQIFEPYSLNYCDKVIETAMNLLSNP